MAAGGGGVPGVPVDGGASAGTTFCTNDEDFGSACVASPAHDAVVTWAPVVSADVLNVALAVTASIATSVAFPSELAPSNSSISPAGFGAADVRRSS